MLDTQLQPQTLAEMNDQFRRMVGYSNCPYPGRMLVTRGIHERGTVFTAKVIPAVRDDTNFTEENDPEGFHDFGVLTVDKTKVFWKIDYFDPDYHMGSDDPLDATKTARVLTVMLPHEW